jgi:hypothetical protein
MPHAPEASTIKVVAQWSNYAPRWTSVQSQNWSNEQRHSRVCTAPDRPHRLDRACIGSQLSNCLTRKVVIVDALKGSTPSSVEEHLGFWIDEAAKTLVLADGTPLTVHRFDDHWITAARGDMSYELDRQNGN